MSMTLTLGARIRALAAPWIGGILALCAGAALADDPAAMETMPAPLAAEFRLIRLLSGSTSEARG